MKITATCAGCGTASQFEPAPGARAESCPVCGKPLTLPKGSPKSRALDAAMKAMEAKEQARGGKPSRAASPSGAYQLGAAPKPNVVAEGSDRPPIWKRQLGSREWIIVGGAVVALSAIVAGWKILTPSQEEDDQATVITQIKTDADHLAADGKLKQAYEKYAQVRNLAAGRDLNAPDRAHSQSGAGSQRCGKQLVQW